MAKPTNPQEAAALIAAVLAAIDEQELNEAPWLELAELLEYVLDVMSNP